MQRAPQTTHYFVNPMRTFCFKVKTGSGRTLLKHQNHDGSKQRLVPHNVFAWIEAELNDC